MAADAIRLNLDTKEIRRNMRDLSEKQVGRAMADALRKTAFEVMDAEKLLAKSVFEFADASTREFIAGRGSFAFTPVSQGKLSTTIYPRPRTERLLVDHERGAVITGQSEEHLHIGGQLAVPIKEAQIKTLARGRIPKKLLPGALLMGEKSRGFVAGGAILERRGGQPRYRKRRIRGAGASRVVALYALIEKAKLAPRFTFYPTARATAKAVFPEKAKRAFEKIRVKVSR